MCFNFLIFIYISGDGIGASALATSSGPVARSGRAKETSGDKTGTETDESAGSESEESSTAGESGGGATDDERDTQAKKDHSSRHNSSRDFATKEVRNEDRVEGNGGAQVMDVDAAETDDEGRPPAGAQVSLFRFFILFSSRRGTYV